MYRYFDAKGESRFVNSWTLTQTDRPPKGKSSEKCLREMERDIAKDLIEDIDTFKSKRLTLNDTFEHYLGQKHGLKASTRHNYKYLYHKYISEFLGCRKFSDIKGFYNHLAVDIGLKSSTIGNIHTILHPIFAMAIRDGYIRVNPTDGAMAELKKNDDRERIKRHALTEQEQKAFIEYVRESKIYNHWLPIFTFLLGTGCRIGEAVGLTWDDCDFQDNIISINHNLVYGMDERTGKSEFHILTTKTKAGEREIPMFEAVKQILLNERIKQMQKGFCKVEVDGYSDFVFINRSYNPYIPQNIDRAIERIIRDYNIDENERAERENREPLLLPHFSAHNLRHTFCTRMCENETNIKIIQEIMGHANITITMDVYTEATLTKKKESFARLEDKIKIY